VFLAVLSPINANRIGCKAIALSIYLEAMVHISQMQSENKEEFTEHDDDEIYFGAFGVVSDEATYL